MLETRERIHGLSPDCCRAPSPAAVHITLHMDCLVMGFVCPLRFECLITHWAFDFIELVGPNILCTIATTAGCNAPFMVWITLKVAAVDFSMLCDCISAYENVVSSPSMDFTMEILHLGGLTTIPSFARAFP